MRSILPQIHLHVLVVDKFDNIAFSSKEKILKLKAEKKKDFGLPVNKFSERVYHYSVRYIPTNLDSSTLHVVNMGRIPHMSFDSYDLATNWARRLRSALAEKSLPDPVTITSIPFDRTEEAEHERQAISLAAAGKELSLAGIDELVAASGLSENP